jgi:hypothetical protein
MLKFLHRLYFLSQITKKRSHKILAPIFFLSWGITFFPTHYLPYAPQFLNPAQRLNSFAAPQTAFAAKLKGELSHRGV